MKVLFIFPHPDDESFGPAALIHQLIEQGHEAHLLTLTKGEATKQRHKFNYSLEQMGEVRYKEMLEVARTLHLTDMEVLDFPDGELSQIDPRTLEKVVALATQKIQPEIVVTYAVHGMSGFHDHLITHAIVKRVFLELQDAGADHLKRLALLTMPDDGQSSFQEFGFKVKHSKEKDIDCVIPLSPENLEAMKSALKCYKTYQDKIEESGVIEKVGTKLYFEFFGEDFDPPLQSLTDKMH
jgi:N-acetylglucosamine malate deacetylase 2